MATSLPNSLPEPFGDQIDDVVRIAVITAEWNGNITRAMTDDCIKTLKSHGVKDDKIKTYTVPGAFELSYAASRLCVSESFDVIIVFGCVIRGGTPHFDYVCQGVTQGITTLNTNCDTPVIFGVLTVDNEQQALERACGPVGHKGAECAEAALKMFRFDKDTDNYFV